MIIRNRFTLFCGYIVFAVFGKVGKKALLPATITFNLCGILLLFKSFVFTYICMECSCTWHSEVVFRAQEVIII